VTFLIPAEFPSAARGAAHLGQVSPSNAQNHTKPRDQHACSTNKPKHVELRMMTSGNGRRAHTHIQTVAKLYVDFRDISNAIREIAEVDVGREEGCASVRTGNVTPEFVSALGLDESAAFLAEQQRVDPDISKIIDLMERDTAPPTWDEVASQSESAKSLWRQWQRLTLKEGVLVRRFEEANGRNNFWQVVIPRQLRAKFLSAVHAGVAGGHFGRHRTELAVKARAYWPGWAGDVRRALRTCEACTKYMRSKPPRQVTLKPILCGEPWEILSLDITGPHPVSRQGFMYI
jgi:hypothetical protein